ncbi:MAG: hypothetical protein R3Y38_05010 [Rikenellaceae bacterium]
MRQFSKILILLVTMLVACTTDVIYITDSSTTKLGSSVYYNISSGDTYASLVDLNSSSLTEVGVLGSATESQNWVEVNPHNYDLVPNYQMCYNGTSWYYASDYATWGNPDASDKFSFFSYAPYQYREDYDNSPWILVPAYTDNAATSDIPYVVYDCPTELTLQSDVMLAEPVYNIYRPSHNHVSFTFHHALTCIGFQVREVVEHWSKTERRIVSLSISGLHSQGVAKMDGSNIEWTFSSDDSDRKEYFAGIAVDPATGYYEMELAGITSDFSSDFMLASGYMMLLPQSLSGVQINLGFTTEAEPDVVEYYHYDLSGSWSANQRIIYNLTVGAEDFESVGVSSYDWEATLIVLTEDHFLIDGISVINWLGEVVSTVDISSMTEGSSTSEGGMTPSVDDWNMIISPGYDVSFDNGTTSAESGTNATPDIWDMSLVPGYDIGGTGESSTSTGGTTITGTDWDSDIVLTTTVSGTTSGSSSEGGASVTTTDWDSDIVLTTTVGGTTSGSTSSGGASVTTTDWDSDIVITTTVGGTGDSSTSSGGASVTTTDWDSEVVLTTTVGGTGEGTTSEGGATVTNSTWDSQIVTESMLEVQNQDNITVDDKVDDSQWTGGSTIVGGDNTESGLTDTNIN